MVAQAGVRDRALGRGRLLADDARHLHGRRPGAEHHGDRRAVLDARARARATARSRRLQALRSSASRTPAARAGAGRAPRPHPRGSPRSSGTVVCPRLPPSSSASAPAASGEQRRERDPPPTPPPGGDTCEGAGGAAGGGPPGGGRFAPGRGFAGTTSASPSACAGEAPGARAGCVIAAARSSVGGSASTAVTPVCSSPAVLIAGRATRDDPRGARDELGVGESARPSRRRRGSAGRDPSRAPSRRSARRSAGTCAGSGGGRSPEVAQAQLDRRSLRERRLVRRASRRGPRPAL